MRLWRQTLIPPIITALLYLTVFGKVVGSRVGIIQGVDYIQFVLPGLAMLTMILASFQNCVSSFFIEKFHRSIDELMVSPLTSFEIVRVYYWWGDSWSSMWDFSYRFRLYGSEYHSHKLGIYDTCYDYRHFMFFISWYA